MSLAANPALRRSWRALSPGETLPPLAAETAIFAIASVVAPVMPSCLVESIVTAQRPRRAPHPLLAAGVRRLPIHISPLPSQLGRRHR